VQVCVCVWSVQCVKLTAIYLLMNHVHIHTLTLFSVSSGFQDVHVMIFVGIVALLVLAVAGMFSICWKNRKTDQKCKYYSQMLELDHLHCVKV